MELLHDQVLTAIIVLLLEPTFVCLFESKAWTVPAATDCVRRANLISAAEIIEAA